MDYRKSYILSLICLVLLTACGGPKDLLVKSPLSVIVGGKDSSSSSIVGSDGVKATSSKELDGPVKVALLVPLSGAYAEVGNGLLDAAQMALFDLRINDFELLPIDTKGTTLGAVRAFKKAARSNVNLVLGPLFSKSAKAVAPLAYEYDINVITFSNDSSLAGEGVFLLGVIPEQQIRRVVDYALLANRTFFAAVVPNNTFGAMVTKAMREQVAAGEAHVTKAEYYLSSREEVAEYVRRAMRSLIRGSKRRLRVIELTQRLKDINKEVIEATEEDALLLSTQEEGSLVTIESIVDTEFFDAEPDLKALLIAEGGQRLRDIVERLKLYDLEQHNIQLLGSGQWDDESLSDIPLLHGALFADTPPDRREMFKERFSSVYGYDAPRISSLAYDGVALAAALAQASGNGDFSFRSITNQRGFIGIDGIFRFKADGTNEQGLAVLTLTEDGVEVVEKAPSAF